MQRRLTAALACAAVVVTLPARAALFDDNEARQRIEATNQRIEQVRRQLDERIGALETQIKSQGLVDIFNQIEQLKRDVAQLRGQLEVLTFELSEAQKRQRDLYVDLDSRLRRLESAGPAAAAPGPAAAPGGAAAPGQAGSAEPPPAAPSRPTAGAMAPSPSSPSAGPSGAFGPQPSQATAPAGAAARGPAGDVGQEQRAYDAALDLFKAGSYGAAAQSFAAFVRTYPRSPLAPSAQYWIGNSQFALRDFRAAIASQRQLVTNYPESQKVPDALLNIATSQIELGDGPAARRTLEDLVARYPQSDAASKARQRLSAR